MDLHPINKSPAPMLYHGENCSSGSNFGRYNIAGWTALRKYLQEHIVNDRLLGLNDGELIPETTCLRIAEVLDMAKGDDAWLQDHANWWRTCGGCRVY